MHQGRGVDVRLSASEQSQARIAANDCDLLQIAELLRIMRRSRECRHKVAEGLFSDPAWEIMLETFSNAVDGKQTTHDKIVEAASLSDLAARRYADLLIDRALIIKLANNNYCLTKRGKDSMLDYIESSMALHNASRPQS